jgi:transposase-like protein
MSYGRAMMSGMRQDGGVGRRTAGGEEVAGMTNDSRFTTGVLNLSDASRFLGVPRQTFHRWARGYERGGALLHVLETQRRREASVTFVAMAEAHVLNALREAGVRPQRIRPALRKLQKEFGCEYVLIAPELATDGVDVLWDFAQTKAGHGLIEGGTGQLVIREIVQDYLQYVAWGTDDFPT